MELVMKEKINFQSLFEMDINLKTNSEEKLEILNSPIKLRELILSVGFDKAASKLEISKFSIYRHHKNYQLGLYDKFDSVPERNIKSFFSDQGIQIEKNNSLIAPYELNNYLPDFNFAVEYNGLYWHSEENKFDVNYHYKKTLACREKGIQLIHIFEDEWSTKEAICRSILSGMIGKSEHKVAGRKCSVVELTNKQMRPFLEKNHLQGYATAAVNLALVYENKIVSIMTFGKPRYNKKVEWELLRLATAINTNVMGGASKLWSYFISKYNPTSIVSYCDNRWFNGNIYLKLGFKLKDSGRPIYWYTDGYRRWHRSRYTKKLCVKKALLMEGQTLTEKQLNNMLERTITSDVLGLFRIWDCGQSVWVYNKNE
jgi:hypothetical protein